MIEMKNLEKLTNIIESILFVSGTQVAISDIAEKLEISDKDVLEIANTLKQKYSKDSGIQLLIFNKKLQVIQKTGKCELYSKKQLSFQKLLLTCL